MRPRVRSLFKSLTNRGRMEQAMTAEMEFHLAARRDDLIRAGLSPAEAERRARLEFGGVERFKEECRQSLGLRLIDELTGDLRYAWRQLRKSPTFTVLATAILAIGIGGSSAIFSTIDAVLLRMLPVQEPEQLRRLEWTARNPDFMRSYNGNSRPGASGERLYWSISYPAYEYLRERTTTFSGLILFSGATRVNASIQGGAVLATDESVSANYFQVLGTSALLGRTLAPEDTLPGQPAVSVITHRSWERMFGSDPRVVGRIIRVNGRQTTIVGVLPKGFCGVNPNACPDMMSPMRRQAGGPESQDVLEKPDYWHFEAIGRLKPGVNEEQARAETELLMRQVILDYAPRGGFDFPQVRLQEGGRGLDELRRDLERPLQVLSWAIGLVLVIACANLAGLLMAKATSRHREMGTRLALGAGRPRLVRQLLAESLLLAILGGTAGVTLAALAGDLIVRLFVREPGPLGVVASVNPKVLLFSLALCLFTGIAFGLFPALRATRGDLLPALRAAGPTADRARFRTGKLLIAVQVALSLGLVTGSALFLRTLANLKSERLGFEAENLLVFQLNPTLNSYEGQRLLNFHEEVVKRIEGLPGVRSVSMSRWGILSGSGTSDSIVKPDGRQMEVSVHYVCPRFFETMGIPLLTGRDVTWSDTESSRRVLVLNRKLASALFDGQSPLGRILELNGASAEIVGMAGDTKSESLRRDARPTVYVPFRQHPQHSMTYAVRSFTEPNTLVSTVRAAIRELDPNVPMYEVKTQKEQINLGIRRERVFAALLTGVAVLGLVLACLGIYGTLAYLVSTRTPEIGIRLALGARGTGVVALLLKESVVPVVAGLLGGLWVSLAVGKLAESLLYGVKPHDLTSLCAAAGVLLLSACVAAWLPARRASRVAPMEALRHE